MTSYITGQNTTVLLPTSPQRYQVIHAKPSGLKNLFSPDPLVDYRWEKPKATDELEVYALLPIKVSCDKPKNVKLGKKPDAPIAVTGVCNLMFDFGSNSPAWLEFDSDDFDGDVLMSLGEYNQPGVTNWMVKHSDKTAKPIKYGNTYRLELNDLLYEGARFGWIHIKTVRKPFTIKSVRLICQAKPANYQGSFVCSNAMMNKIWYTGAYTVRANFQKDFLGAILVDRGDRYSWTGDAHVSQLVSMLAFGNYDFVKANIVRTANDANGIASYSLLWVKSLIDYYYYSNDRKMFADYIANASGKLDSAYFHWGTNPKLVFYGWDERLGAGFETPERTENQLAYKMLTIDTWKSFAKALMAFGNTKLAAKYRKFANEKTAEITTANNWYTPLGIHAATDAINADIPSESALNQLWKDKFTNRLLRISYSPFNQFFIIRAMAKMNRYTEALTTIDDCWGGQIRNGATTTYEIYHPSWNALQPPNSPVVNMECGFTSLAHPWSAGATAWLTEEILGIKPTSPGFTTFDFTPHLSSRISSVKGEVPCFDGLIHASFNLNTGKGQLSVPANKTARIGIPKSGKSVLQVKINSKIAQKTSENNEFVYFDGIKQGEYTIHAKYSGKVTKPVLEKMVYTYNQHPIIDTITKGNWVQKYGKRGWLLCDFEGRKLNRMQKPDFVNYLNVRYTDNFRRMDLVIPPVSSDDKRALISNIATETNRRSVGALNVITTSVEVVCSENKPYNLSLYFVDWLGHNLTSAIEVFDYDSREILMPDTYISNYKCGKYITFSFDRSVLIRIQRVRGENSALCGVFFD